MKAFFVTGTDTGVGKTTVSCAVLEAAAARGLRTAAMKPAESGCARDASGALVPADALALSHAATVPFPLDIVCPYRFEAPVAPGVAAEREGRDVDFDVIARAYATMAAETPDLLLVEGAGGLLVPLGRDRMIADLAHHLALPLLVVARDSLGTINHTLLTIESARGRGLEVAAVVFSAAVPGTAPDEVGSNASEITRASGVPVLGALPHLDRGVDRVSVVEAHVDLQRLLH